MVVVDKRDHILQRPCGRKFLHRSNDRRMLLETRARWSKRWAFLRANFLTGNGRTVGDTQKGRGKYYAKS